MENRDIVSDITSLPPQAQQQVIDFVAFLKTRYPARPRTGNRERTTLAEEAFIGMWRDRTDMQDSTAWVRHLRQREWEHSTWV